MSDNGGLSTSEGHPTSNLPLRGGKGWLYEGGIREPMIVRWPGVTTPGSINNTPVISTDFYPTILEITGSSARPDQHLDGESFTALLNGAADPVHDQLFWHFPHYGNQGFRPGSAIREGPYKLIEFCEDKHVELYHVEKDIGEQLDLSQQEPERVNQMKKKLHQWLQEVNARPPTENPGFDPNTDRYQ